jgi:hypothetical protein
MTFRERRKIITLDCVNNNEYVSHSLCCSRAHEGVISLH